MDFAPWTVPQVIGQNMRSRRDNLGMTQAQLGERLGNWLGAPWTRQQVFMAEKGGRAFTASEIVALSMALDTLPGVLFDPRRAGALILQISDEVKIDGGFLAGPDLAGSALEDYQEVLQTLHRILVASARYSDTAEQIVDLSTRLDRAVASLSERLANPPADAS